MEQVAIQLLIWMSATLAVKGQALAPDPDATMRIKAAESCLDAVAHAPVAPTEGDVLAPPVGGIPTGNVHDDHAWMIRRAVEGDISGADVRVFYNADTNTAIIVHSAPRWVPAQ
jgi:hypothetical protein